jgi:hypothetical protein
LLSSSSSSPSFELDVFVLLERHYHLSLLSSFAEREG